MKLPILSKRDHRIDIFLATVIALGIIFYFTLNGRIQSSPPFLATRAADLYVQEKTPKIPLSARLEIPKIGVDAGIESLSLTSDGAVDVPKGPEDAAWFDLGPRPGERGNAVIVGHSGWKNGIAAVFDKLSQLQKGDRIYIDNTDGSVTIFVVRDMVTYDQHQDVSDVFISNDEKAHLNLITCTGIWNTILKGRSDRLIVFTDKE